jgi:peptidoglycan/LPS O-acetylase OafA/YrhL
LPYAPGLDGIRAIAVFGVVMYHARVSWLPGGFLGVDLFFVLSGFLITSLLLAERRRSGRIDLGRFWLGRARRLLPAALLVIAVCLVVVAVFYPGDLATLRGDALASVLYINNWHQILASHSYFAAFGRPSLLQHFWSLSVEEQFYLIWPLVLAGGLAIGRRGLVICVAICVAIASIALMAVLYHPGADPSRVYYGTDTRVEALMIGALLAFAWPLGQMTRPAGRGASLVLDAIGLAGLVGVILAMRGWHDYDSFLYDGGFAIVALAGAALIAAAAHPASRIALALGAAPLRWIGQRSYGIYLWHWPVMALTRPRIDLRWSSWILVSAQVGVTLILAALSFRFVEMPIRRGEAWPAVRGWLDRARPRARLAAMGGGVAAVGLLLASAAIVPAVASAPPDHVLASAAAGAPASALSLSGSHDPQRGATSANARAPHAGKTANGAASGPSAAGGVGATGALPAGQVLAVGASVMLAAEGSLEQLLHARVDAAVGRQPVDIIDRLEAYRAAGALPRNVVVQIGDNGPVYYADMMRLEQVLRGVRHVVLVNVREPTSWQDEVNAMLTQTVRTWPQATVADWLTASSNPDLTYDGAHPDDAGGVVYANLVARALELEAGGVSASG